MPLLMAARPEHPALQPAGAFVLAVGAVRSRACSVKVKCGGFAAPGRAAFRRCPAWETGKGQANTHWFRSLPPCSRVAGRRGGEARFAAPRNQAVADSGPPARGVSEECQADAKFPSL
ncbi:MAG TPA: hypothetical protein VKK79_07435 [Candidatus Lokiarchaeia archaeon]|nr:hypothetical protein [Candidatus Lokiarchaeia archaeon]